MDGAEDRLTIACELAEELEDHERALSVETGRWLVEEEEGSDVSAVMRQLTVC